MNINDNKKGETKVTNKKQENVQEQEKTVEKQATVVSFDIESLKNVGAIVDKKPIPHQIKWKQGDEQLAMDVHVKKKTFQNSEKLIFGEQSQREHVIEMIVELIVDENGKKVLTKELVENMKDVFIVACMTAINEVNEKKS